MTISYDLAFLFSMQFLVFSRLVLLGVNFVCVVDVLLNCTIICLLTSISHYSQPTTTTTTKRTQSHK